jgi:CRISPR/Cas system endoribonuclease Cas6 (RAMP superfamily)
MRKEKDELYRAYLLRCWREGHGATDDQPLWRFCVENVFGERRRQGFGSLEALVAFLRLELTSEEGGA